MSLLFPALPTCHQTSFNHIHLVLLKDAIAPVFVKAHVGQNQKIKLLHYMVTLEIGPFGAGALPMF